MTSPAFRAIKESIPGCSVTLLTSPGGAEAARLMPFVDDVLTYQAPWMKATNNAADASSDRRFIERLGAASFDAAVVFTVYSQNPLPSALMCYLADIPLRLAHCRENPYHILTDWVRDQEPEKFVRHETRRQLDLVNFIGARTLDERLSISVPASARIQIESLLQQLLDDSCERWIVMHPGASASSRRYAPENYALVTRQLVEEMDCQVIFTGTASERSLIETIRAQAGVPSHSVAGLLDLGQLAALLERAPLLISNNTGTVHIAAAVGTSVLDLYALTNPQHMPWRVPHRVLFHDVPCRFCYKSICPEGHHDCLRLVSPTRVVTAARELLAIRPLATTGGAQLVHARH
jgi:lipopolysaccharide heptosyltransferase II